MMESDSESRIQRILGRQLNESDRSRLYSLNTLPTHIFYEASKIAQNSSSVYAVYYLRLQTGASLMELKSYVEDKGWLIGGIFD